MNKLLYIFVFLFVAIGCVDEDQYIISDTASLRFNRDTLSLDTILAGLPTQTDTFKVYNPNNKSIRLTRAWLEKGANSPFRVNIDGEMLANGVGTDFEIARKDSMFVFFFLNTPEIDEDAPAIVRDRLFFQTEGGKVQNVVLQAYAQGVYHLKGITISSDTTFTANRPYQIFDSLVVEQGATLKLLQGARLYFHPGASLIVRGKLQSEGSAQQNVVLRGDRLGNMLSGIPYDRIPNQWGGVFFAAESYDNSLMYTDIHSGQYGIRCDSSNVLQTKLTMNGCVVHNVASDGLSLKSNKVFVINSQLTNAGGDCVSVKGGDVQFIHCTIAQFYPLVGGDGVALRFSNYDGRYGIPLTTLNVFNTIVTGRNKDDVQGEQQEKGSSIAFNYLFRNCLLNTEKVADEHFLNCFWEGDNPKDFSNSKNFTPTFNYDKLIFTFQLDSLSQAVGHADDGISNNYPTDRLGHPRLQGNTPDIGCYERQ